MQQSERNLCGGDKRALTVLILKTGISVGGVVLSGGWVFTVALAAAVYVGAREYFELVRSHGFADGMTPPPRYGSRVCSVICALMPLLTLYLGQIDVSVTFAAFVVAMALLMQRRIPCFAQLTSAMFGLFYIGYLPCFWVKLRCRLAVPALNTGLGASWPVLLGGPTQWTVGLVATLISFSSIIAADTFAFIGGKEEYWTGWTVTYLRVHWHTPSLKCCYHFMEFDDPNDDSLRRKRYFMAVLLT
ncbi:hypothetical protein RND71_007409 [Anisodus tanguticus]|uniref:phosphatidate cytidylyltransferase n=1 Tax=Anisodus tanguticus TaxID=243964 RepID=A0AAE1VTK9_9SOLA|nr:hypothetical protein RND71_007409 [Anisodus tanguticus]